MTKFCTKCEKEKTLSEFNKRKVAKDGLQGHCRSCKVSYQKGYRKKNPVRKRTTEENRALTLKKYGITLDDYNQMFAEQGGCCRICNKHQSELKKKLYVDHCHTTNKVRGLLCQHCNSGLGYFFDSPESLKRAIKYLKDNNNDKN